jgi:hypothetical protein
MNHKHTFIIILCISVLVVATGIKVHLSNQYAPTDKQASLQQQINDLKDELTQVKNQYVNLKLSQAVASTNDMRVQWAVIEINGQPILTCTTDNGNKPVSWGFRDDGIVLWKCP